MRIAFLNSEYFIYLSLIGKFQNYAAICEIRQEHGAIDENQYII